MDFWIGNQQQQPQQIKNKLLMSVVWENVVVFFRCVNLLKLSIYCDFFISNGWWWVGISLSALNSLCFDESYREKNMRRQKHWAEKQFLISIFKIKCGFAHASNSITWNSVWISLMMSMRKYSTKKWKTLIHRQFNSIRLHSTFLNFRTQQKKKFICRKEFDKKALISFFILKINYRYTTIDSR